jgi:hypothetical protein
MSSVLQSFHILFESNADKVRLAEQEAEKAGRDLEGQLGKVSSASHRGAKEMESANKEAAGSFAFIDIAVDKMKENALDAFKEIATSFIGIFAVSAVIDRIAETTEMVEHLGQVSKELGVNVSDLDAWDGAVVKSGGSAEGFQASLRGLNGRLAAMSIGGQGAKRTEAYFKALGIQGVVTHGQLMPLPDLLLKMAGSFEKMDRQKSAAIGSRLGLDPATILLLQSGTKAVQDQIDRQKELGTVTQKDVEIAAEFEDQWKDTKTVLTEGTVGMGSVVLPVLTDILEHFNDFIIYLRDHRELVIGFFTGVAAVVTTLYAPAMIEAALTTLAAVWPFLVVAAAVAAFALAYEDLADYLEGKNSLIGELAKRWPIIGTVIHGVAKEVTAIYKAFVALFEYIVSGKAFDALVLGFANAYKKVDDFLSKLLGFPNIMGAVFKSIDDDVKRNVGFIIDQWNSVVKVIQAAIDLINKLLGINAVKAIINVVEGKQTAAQKAADAKATASLPAVQEQEATAKTLQPGYVAPKTDDAGFNIIGTGNPPWQGFGDLPGQVGRPVRPPTGDLPGQVGRPVRPPTPASVPGLAPAQSALATAATGSAALVTSPDAIKGAAQKAAGASITNNTTINAPITINPPAGTDPAAMTRAATDHLAKQLKNAHNDVNDGISG